MNQYILTPVLIASLLGVLADLEDLSQDATQRTVEYTQSAVLALDCAYEARPLTECAPDITSPEFSEEIARTNQILTDLQQTNQISARAQ
jgi:hypothetical protein